MKRGRRFVTGISLALVVGLGWDGNVLRRRSDRTAACGAGGGPGHVHGRCTAAVRCRRALG
jgi:hypothetical protein